MSLLRHRDDLANAGSFDVVGEQFAEESLAALQIENLVLRHELAVLRRQHPRPRLQPEEGTLLASLSGLLHRSLGHDTPVPTVRELERVRPPPVSCAAGTSPVD